MRLFRSLFLIAAVVLSAAPARAQFMSWDSQRDVMVARGLGYMDMSAFRSDQEAARRAQDQALSRNTINVPVEWFNRSTGNGGRTRIVEMGRDAGGNPCRVVEEELLVNGSLRRQSGLVCHDGVAWRGVR